MAKNNKKGNEPLVNESLPDDAGQTQEEATSEQESAGEQEHALVESPEGELANPHEVYCDVCGESLLNCTCTMPDESYVKKVYVLENLNSSNIAARMERKIKELPDVKYANITYTTKQLRIAAADPDALLPQIQDICTSIDSEVKVVPRTKSPGYTITKTYIAENLSNPNDAGKIEKLINEMDGVTSATLTYTTKQLRVTGNNPDWLLKEMQTICAEINPDIMLIEKDTRPKSKDTLNVKNILPTAREDQPLFQLTDNMRSLLLIICGAVLFIVGEIIMHSGMRVAGVVILVLAWLVLGIRVIVSAVKNVMDRHFLDINFLMTIATLGAFIIGAFAEAVGVMLFYRIGEFFEHYTVERSRSQIMDAADMRPEVVNLVIGSEIQVIDAEKANIGDILLIRPGDRVPLDGIIVEGESRLDTSPITGEPVPVSVSYGDEITSGCINTSGDLKMRVEKVLEDSMVTRILDSVENAAANKTKTDSFITKLADIYTPIVVILAIFVAIIPSMVTGHWHYYVYTALTFLVVSCPCALVLSIPLAFFSGIGAGSKKGILFKGGTTLEAMKNVDAVVMDKTGVITTGSFVFEEAVPAADDITPEQLLAYSASCELSSTHPIGISIRNAAQEQHLEIEHPSETEEIAGYGIRAVLPEEGTLLCGNRKLMEKYGVSLENYENSEYGAEVLIAKDGKFIGSLIISDTIKEDAKSAVSNLKHLGVSAVMLTGDAQENAMAVANTAGIEEVHAQLLQQDKLSALSEVKNSHGSVLYVGDGINDAAVLAGADVSAAMGSGADASIGVSDVVYMNSNTESIPDSLSIAKTTYSVAIQNVILALAVKIIVMVLGLCGFASLWLAVIADTAAAILCILNATRLLFGRRRR